MPPDIPSEKDVRGAVSELFQKTYEEAGNEILGALLVIGRNLNIGPEGTPPQKAIDYVLDGEMGELCNSTKFFQELLQCFDDPVIKTRIHILIYCRIIEADYLYLIFFNLLRLIDGADPVHSFFIMEAKKGGTEAPKELEYPWGKINELKRLSDIHDLRIGGVLADIWQRDVRNAYSHSKFMIHKDGTFWGTAGSSISNWDHTKGCNLTPPVVEKLSVGIRALLSQFASEYNEYIQPFADGEIHRISAGDLQFDQKRKCWAWAD